jgi:hypothetical protein
MANKLSFVVGNTKVDNVYEFDNQETVLSKYALTVYRKDPDNLQTSPRFLKFLPPVKKFGDGEKYQIVDIRDEIAKMTLMDVSRRETILKLKLNFPKITSRDIGILWMVSKGYDKITTEEFSKIYQSQSMKPYFLEIHRQFFPTALLIKREVEKYISVNIPNELVSINKTIQRETRIYNELSKFKPVKTSNFKLEETTEETFLHLPDGESLYDVFNAIKTSKNIPFVLLVDMDNNKKYYKIFDGILPPDEWIFRELDETLNRGVYFYVLDPAVDKIYEQTNLVKSYNEGLWKPGNSVVIAVKNNLSSENPIDRVLESLEDRIKYEKGDKLDMGIKGTFTIPAESLNPIVMADLIALNPSFKYFTFFNEQKKSALLKKRFTFYYQQNHTSEYETAITVTLTQIGSPDSPSVEVRLSRAIDFFDVERFKTMLSYLWSLYRQKHDDIETEYKNMYKGAVYKTKKVVQNKMENKKTGSLLLALQNANPDGEAFSGGGYSEKCQANQQPYLVPKDKLEEVQKKLRPQYGKHGIMEWPLKSGNMYACHPREGFEKNKHGWPGLVPTDPLKSTESHLKKYPFKPCCFTVDQYNKKSSGYNKYINGGDALADKKKQSTDRPLGESKEAPPGRTAELPYFLQLVANSSGYEKTGALRKEILPILRLGVIFGPTSLVHCLEQATNPKYPKSSDEQKIKIVGRTLKSVSQLDLSVARQELYGIADDVIRDHLSDETAYIDPDYYISIFEKYYDLNIILFKVDSQFPNGDMVIPRHSTIYLDKCLNSNRKTVIIIKREVPFEWKYQCELVIKHGNVNEYSFDNTDPFVELLSKIKNETNKVYITSPIGDYKKYKPIDYTV